MGGLSIPGGFAQKAGFEHDRRWMLVNAQNEFITQRSIPQLSQFLPTINEGLVTVKYKDESISWEIIKIQPETLITKVWDDIAITQCVGQEIDNWFSERIGEKVRLVKLKDDNSRQHVNSINNESLNVSLADGYPYLVLSEESLLDLNKILENPVSLMHFRPNIVVEASKAHDEDLWPSLLTRDTVFENIKPCARCQVINIDPITTSVSKEPTKTLATYRKQGNKILFGSLYTCKKEGFVAVGDEVVVE